MARSRPYEWTIGFAIDRLMVPVFYGIFIRPINHVLSGVQRSSNGTLLYAADAIQPALVYILVFALMVGIEGVLNVPLLS